MKKIFLLLILCGLLSVNHLIAQCVQISMIGEFSDWVDDIDMIQDEDSVNLWTVSIVFKTEDDMDLSGFVDMKFREHGDWNYNWGDDEFPCGTGLSFGYNIPAQIGTWNVTFNCQTGAYCFQQQIGISQNSVPEHFNLLPNPVSDYLQLELVDNERLENASVVIFNLTGKEIMSRKLAEAMTVLDVRALPAGIYLIKVVNVDGVRIRKFVKE